MEVYFMDFTEFLWKLHNKAKSFMTFPKPNTAAPRSGQAYMNALFKINKVMYDRVTGTDVDPFYDDSKLEAFFDFLEKNYESN